MRPYSSVSECDQRRFEVFIKAVKQAAGEVDEDIAGLRIAGHARPADAVADDVGEEDVRFESCNSLPVLSSRQTARSSCSYAFAELAGEVNAAVLDDGRGAAAVGALQMRLLSLALALIDHVSGKSRSRETPFCSGPRQEDQLRLGGAADASAGGAFRPERRRGAPPARINTGGGDVSWDRLSQGRKGPAPMRSRRLVRSGVAGRRARAQPS